MPHKTYRALGAEKYWGLENLSHLFPQLMLFPLSMHLFSVDLDQSWQGKVDSHSTGCVLSILWSQSILHWSLYLRGVLSKWIFTSVTFWKWAVLKILLSKAVWGKPKPEKLHTFPEHRKTLDQSLRMIQWRNCYWTWIAAHLYFLERSLSCESWLQTSSLSKKKRVYIQPPQSVWLFWSVLS